MDGGDYFRHRGHADGVGAERAKGADFGSGFKIRAEHHQVNAFRQVDSEFGGQFFRLPAHVPVIGVAHIGKTGACALVVGADKRILTGKIDVVFDQHQTARGKFRVERTGGVGDDQPVDADGFKRVDDFRNHLRTVAFVEMETSLQAENFALPQPADDHFAGMTGNGGAGKAFDRRIVNCQRVFDGVGDGTEAGTEDDGGLRSFVRQQTFELFGVDHAKIP